MMTNHLPVPIEPRVERLAIIETDALHDRIPLLVSSNQRLLAQGMDESIQEFSRRFVKRIASLPAARTGLLLLNDEADFNARWNNLLALASRLQAADDPQLIISVRSGSGSEAVGWELLERASHEAFFRGIRLRLQFLPSQAVPAAPSSEVRWTRPSQAPSQDSESYEPESTPMSA
jgi:hypothetical protein